MYFITVSNGLLEGEHQKKMGSAVWQFMWCLDKLTVINEDGEGKVLGGKPINLSDISGASIRTNSRNLNKLEKLGYIKLIHTPYGISIRVFKSKKIFQKQGLDKSGVPKRSDKSGVPLTKSGVPNKIIQLDNTTEILSEETSQEKELNNQLKQVIELFGLFNSNNYSWFKNKTQREDIKWLINQYSLEKVKKAIYLTAFCFKDKFYPSIGTPHELREKWVKMKKFWGGKEIKDKRFIQDFELYMIEKEKNKDKKGKILTATIAGRKITYELN